MHLNVMWKSCSVCIDHSECHLRVGLDAKSPMATTLTLVAAEMG